VVVEKSVTGTIAQLSLDAAGLGAARSGQTSVHTATLEGTPVRILSEPVVSAGQTILVHRVLVVEVNRLRVYQTEYPVNPVATGPPIARKARDGQITTNVTRGEVVTRGADRELAWLIYYCGSPGALADVIGPVARHGFYYGPTTDIGEPLDQPTRKCLTTLVSRGSHQRETVLKVICHASLLPRHAGVRHPVIKQCYRRSHRW
jgi:hypothetical protein